MILMEEATILVLLVFSLHMQKIYTAEIDIISGSSFLTENDTLVSPARTFELGFFNPGSSDNTYVGIWYKKISVKEWFGLPTETTPHQCIIKHVMD